jgi:hypothetical protein
MEPHEVCGEYKSEEEAEPECSICLDDDDDDDNDDEQKKWRQIYPCKVGSFYFLGYRNLAIRFTC